MNRFDRLYAKFSGFALIAAPLLLVIASLIKAGEIGSSTGRWYDSWVEGMVMFLGMSLLIVALLALSRIVGSRRPVLGLISAIFGVLGTSAAFFPIAIRLVGASALAVGIPVEQLDMLFGGSDVPVSGPPNFVVPFLMLFFLNFFLLGVGLWWIREVPRYSSVLLPTGAILFMVAESGSEVIVVAYVASTVVWLLAMAPVGMRLLRNGEEEIAANLNPDPTAA